MILTQDIKGIFSTKTRISVIQHINILKEKNQMIITRLKKKAFDKANTYSWQILFSK